MLLCIISCVLRCIEEYMREDGPRDEIKEARSVHTFLRTTSLTHSFTHHNNTLPYPLLPSYHFCLGLETKTPTAKDRVSVDVVDAMQSECMDKYAFEYPLTTEERAAGLSRSDIDFEGLQASLGNFFKQEADTQPNRKGELHLQKGGLKKKDIWAMYHKVLFPLYVYISVTVSHPPNLSIPILSFLPWHMRRI